MVEDAIESIDRFLRNRCLVALVPQHCGKLSLPVPVRTEFIRAGGQAGITTQDFFIFFIDLKKGTLPTMRTRLGRKNFLNSSYVMVIMLCDKIS